VKDSDYALKLQGISVLQHSKRVVARSSAHLLVQSRRMRFNPGESLGNRGEIESGDAFPGLFRSGKYGSRAE
jgi:hypothetical protein